MSQGRRCGRPLTLSEHAEIAQWNRACGDGWPRIELALNYPETPEMFGVVERGQVGPTLFLWLTERGAVVEPFSGGAFAYPTLTQALDAIRRWAAVLVAGRRVPFGQVR